MRNENLPIPPSPETPPLAPYDPPDPAPQAAAWHRALMVIGCVPSGREFTVVKHSLSKTGHRDPHRNPSSDARVT
jgi:hypothetical protein